MMKALHVYLAAVISILFAGSATAEQLPTDVDLRAAYCVPILKGQIAALNAALGSGADLRGIGPELIDANRQYSRDRSDALARLQAYLLPRLGQLEIYPLVSAMKRGEIDSANGVWSSMDGCANTCGIRTATGEAARQTAITCFEACTREDPQMKRTLLCIKPDWLPF